MHVGKRESLEGKKKKKLLHWPQDLALSYFLGLVSYYKYSSFILSSSSETHSASPLALAEKIGSTLDHLGCRSDDLGLMPFTF